MKRIFPVCSCLLLAIAAASAQVASHAPTVFTKPPSAATAPAPAFSAAALVAETRPVARVNGAVLTNADLVREEYSIFPYARQHGGALPKELEPQIRDGAMKMIVFEELVYQEALRRKMVVLPARMQRAEADFHKQFASPDEFNTLLQSEFHGSLQALRDKIRRSLLIEALLKIEVDQKGAVTPVEVRAFYLKNPTRFQHPETFTFQTISILPPAKPTPDQIKEGHTRAETALKQAKATKTAEDFGLLAEKLSDDDFRVMMGEHKPVPAEQLAPPVLNALHAMKPGDVSDVIQIEQAYTIVRLAVHTPAGESKFAQVSASLTKELQQAKTNQLRSALDKKLRQAAKIDEL